MTPPRSVACVAEDRAGEATALKLLIASLATHCSDLPVEVWFPPATDSFSQWLVGFPLVTLHTDAVTSAKGWNGKPDALLRLLDDGVEEIWWIDSDVIVTSDFRHVLPPLDRETLVVAQEALNGRPDDGGARASGWQIDVTRVLEDSVNTCVLRVTPAHRELLTEWRIMLQRPEYLAAQARPWYDRPVHLISDQDVLTALLTSERFARVPLVWLRRGHEIIQYFGPSGYPTRDRLRNLRRHVPPFVHEQGGNKPWHERSPRGGPRGAFDRLLTDSSPYTVYARRHRDTVASEAGEADWIDKSTLGGRALRAAGAGSAPLTGLPLALAYTISRLARR